eukprot:246719-Chlamydomonas_euryale.AAC.1
MQAHASPCQHTCKCKQARANTHASACNAAGRGARHARRAAVRNVPPRSAARETGSKCLRTPASAARPV